jgi:ABC-2 type transport system ATP-binding protein
MDDIEALCTRILLINHGVIAYDGSLEELRRRVTQARYLTVEFADDSAWADDPDVSVVRRNGQTLTLSFDPRRIAAADLITRIAARYAVRDLLVENPPIEAIIARLYAEGAA